MASPSPLVVHADPALEAQLRGLAGRRMVFLAGIPGTGKSLVVHQITHLATARGRRVHLLQWDVARPVFEASPAGQRYPLADGVTHAAIRKAAGLWVRSAVAAWNASHPDARDLLLGETPFVGNRFVELAQRQSDAAEAFLADDACRFAIAVPSAAVREFLEAERERRAAHPLHPREREDAPPQVLRALWQDLARLAAQLGIATPPPTADAGVPYDPPAYRGVYERILQHRHVEVVALDTVLPTGRLSVYDFSAYAEDVAPTPAEANRFVEEVERRYPDRAVLDDEIAGWWRV
jgi:hypothetical protein